MKSLFQSVCRRPEGQHEGKVTGWTRQRWRVDSKAPLALQSAVPGMQAGLFHPFSDFPTWLSIVSAFPQIKVKVILSNHTLQGYTVGGLDARGQPNAVNAGAEAVNSLKLNIAHFSFVLPSFTLK